MEKSEDLASWVEIFYKKLTSPKIIKYGGYLALILFFGLMSSAIIVAVSAGPYNIIDNWISDMGSFIYTPAPFLLDAAVISTGILLIPFTFYLEKHIAPLPRRTEEFPPQHRWTYRLTSLAFFLNCFGSIGMIGVGIFSEDRDYLIPGSHFVFSVILFGSFALGAVFLGLALTISDRKVVPSPWNFVLGLYGVHGLLIVGTLAALDLRPLTEWIIFFALIGWLLPLFFFALRHAEKQLKNKKGI